MRGCDLNGLGIKKLCPIHHIFERINVEIIMQSLDVQVLNLVKLHQPIKARQIAKILSQEFNYHIDRSDVNSILYAMKSTGQLKIDDEYQWSLANSQAFINEEPKIEPIIEFTEEQASIINLDPKGHLLIKGQAGSGKTTILSARTGKILSALNKGSVLFLTYNSALCAYVKNQFKKIGLADDIDVHTFHDWAKNCSEKLGCSFSGWVDNKEREQILEKLIPIAKEELGNHRLYELEDSHIIKWWSDEIAWLFGQYIINLSNYLKVERVGRGNSIRLVEADRYFVWNVYELYVEWLEENNKQDYDNPAGLILNTLEQKNIEFPDELKYDHIMVDEVQDFDKSWLLAVMKLPRVSLTLAGDLAQKIYKRNFTWKSVGINIQGRTHNIVGSHRTTYEIMEVAEFLLKNNSVTNEDDFINPVKPKKHGNKVLKILGSNPKNAYEKGYDFVAEQFKRMRATSVVVAMPFSNQCYPAQKALEQRGLTVKAVKGASLGKLDGGIVVTTYHQLKGLEFDHVIIMGLHDTQYPERLISQIAESDVQNEIDVMKRVLYVAMTRAKQSVTLVGSNPFCRFFNDIPNELFEIQ